MPSHKYIISGGGTGGHIFPAIAIARAIQELEPDANFLFVGAKGRMEMEKVPAAGFTIEGLWISGLQRKLTVRNLLFPLKLMSSLLQARAIISRFKPDAVIGVGGYASGPLLRVATARKIPSLIQEQNSFPGITNRILASRVNKICVAYTGMEKWFPKEKIIITGNPVRPEVTKLEGKHPRGMEHFGTQAGKPVLLVIGGSLGARTLNESIAGNLEEFARAGVEVIWQTGKNYGPIATELVQKSGLNNIKVHPFINRMDLAYAIADLVISRAGAISISELCVVKKPAILVPSPNVAEDHQTRNAEALANNHAAILVKDADAKSVLAKLAVETIFNEEKCEQLSNNIGKMAHNNAAQAIAAEIIRLARSK
jgi:UDP-N-acetylglucosamine--N-acetylmuramyl-(pentapeptide) pyrophosphoryl-undecaprenol N-acetylglucosamine transferase